MVYQPHIRMTARGTLPGPEIWTTGLAYRFGTFTIPQGRVFIDTYGQDAANDWGTWFTAVKSMMAAPSILNLVNLSVIKEDGRADYSRDFTPVPAVTASATVAKMPNQAALVATLRTGQAGRRHRGRMFVPCGGAGMAAGGNGHLAANAEPLTLRTATKQLIIDLNNLPGADPAFVTAQVVIASGMELGALTPVTAVAVGTRPDVMRRRANAIVEPKTFENI